MGILLIFVFLIAFTTGIDYLEAYYHPKVKECEYHNWMFKNGSGLECTRCGKIVTDETR